MYHVRRALNKGRYESSRRWTRPARGVALLLVVGMLLPLVWYGLNLLYVSTDNEADYAVKSDVIIVLGCPSYEGNVISTTFSACVRARSHHAAQLYHRGMAPHIIATGGLTGPPPSEAAAMAQVMQADGVPASAITLDEEARDTVQNIQRSRAIMRREGWQRAILVTEPHQLLRVPCERSSTSIRSRMGALTTAIAILSASSLSHRPRYLRLGKRSPEKMGARSSMVVFAP
jgi:uncharacterized SAM-binding protein YcdF (DUF218 family)